MGLKAVTDLSAIGGPVTSVTGTANQIAVSPTTGAAIVSLATNVITPGNFTIKSGSALTLGNAAVTGLTPGVLANLTNATIVLTDSMGQAYRIPCTI